MSRLTITEEKFDYCRDYCNAGDCQYKAGIIPEKCLDAMLYEKLRDYEDTGLEPEEIRELLYDSTGPLHKKLGKWIKAEAEGRLIVLPETVYQHDAERIYESKVRRVIYETDAGFAFDERAIGQTVFLTRKEAEAALKEADHDQR